MKLFRKLKPELFLRLGLAGTLIYSGLDLFQNPTNWQWALGKALPELPQAASSYITNSLGMDKFLKGIGIIELLLAALLLAWFLPKKALRFTASILALGFAFILLFLGLDIITFYNIGLLGAALALLAIAYRK